MDTEMMWARVPLHTKVKKPIQIIRKGHPRQLAGGMMEGRVAAAHISEQTAAGHRVGRLSRHMASETSCGACSCISAEKVFFLLETTVLNVKQSAGTKTENKEKIELGRGM